MTRLKLFQIDAFARVVCRGNPAAVCPRERWLEDDLMQAIAAENNLAATAFCVARDDAAALRWFTPRYEVDLCGHATVPIGDATVPVGGDGGRRRHARRPPWPAPRVGGAHERPRA